MRVMRVMRAAVCRAYGPPESIDVGEIEPPSALSAGQARVRVAAAAVNYPDVLLMAGKYQVTLDVPFVPGSEFAGVVVEVLNLVLLKGCRILGFQLRRAGVPAHWGHIHAR